MMSDAQSQDPLDFVKNMWSSMGFPLPGMVTPTLDTNELDKRITDLKAVEGWLKSNLGLLQMTIHGLEMQRTTLAAMQAMSQAAADSEGQTNPFMSPALWPWPFVPQADKPGESASAAAPTSAPEASEKKA
jgi:hypothetical protein